MPKLKTNKGASKRFQILKSGKVKRSKAYGNHILTKKTTKRKRNLRKIGYIDKTDLKMVRKNMPYA